ncbi:MAG: triose-phosphate isomerase [Alphaproteobacteria bacterium]|nr:triose-phosphate isomerase [Alphaproteobacteria bacterium]
MTLPSQNSGQDVGAPGASLLWQDGALTGKLVVGNWKMNGLAQDAKLLVQALLAKGAKTAEDGQLGHHGQGQILNGVRMAICPPFTLLSQVRDWLAGGAIALGAQDCHAEPAGAFTGNISAAMLADAGCQLCILGHSERRQAGETSVQIAAKLAAAHHNRLLPILCIGETLAQRQAGETLAVLADQLTNSLPFTLTGGNPPLVIAYEPVWAIGTGLTATLDQIAEVHQFLRQQTVGLGHVPLLYGGSVKASNAAEIMALGDVDGVLVGGASLNAEEFWQIALAAKVALAGGGLSTAAA